MTEENNVVPEAELARRRLVLSSTENIIASLRDVVEDVKELVDAGVPTETWVDVLDGQLSAEVKRFLPSRKLMVNALAALSQCFHGRSFADAANDFVMSEFTGIPIPGAAASVTPPRMESGVKDMHASPAEARMKQVITRLFESAPKLKNPDGTDKADQAPAIEAHVVLRGNVPPLAGVMSTTPEGGLKLLTPMPKEGKLLEHFFDYADVVTVVLVRDIKGTETSRIVTA